MNFFKTALAYADMVKIGHTLFALPFALSAIGLAYLEGYKIGCGKFILIILAFACARATAMGFNRVADADIDAVNERTKKRPIQSGKISLSDAKLFTFLAALFFVVFAFLINTLCGFLALPALAVLIGYSYAKRFTATAHYILGLALALAPIGAWIAVTGEFDLRICALGAGLLFHISAFDLFYSLQDRKFDVAHNLHSIPAVFGERATFIFAAISFLLALGFFYLTGSLFDLGKTYMVCVAFVAAAYAAAWFLVFKFGSALLNPIFLYVNIGASFVILLGICSKLFY